MLKKLFFLLIGAIIFILFWNAFTPYIIWCFNGNVDVAIPVLILIIIICGLFHSFITKWNKIVLSYWILFLISNTSLAIHEWGNSNKIIDSVEDYIVVQYKDIDMYSLYRNYGIHVGNGDAIYIKKRLTENHAVIVNIYSDKVNLKYCFEAEILGEKTFDIVKPNDDRDKTTVYDYMGISQDIYTYNDLGTDKLQNIYICLEPSKISNEKEITEIKNSDNDNKKVTYEEGLLYKGFYTISGQSQFMSSGEYSIPQDDIVTEISIYDNHIEIFGHTITFECMNGSYRVYEGSTTGFLERFFVSPSYDIYEMTELLGPFGSEWVKTDMVKGDCTLPKQYPHNNTDLTSVSNHNAGKVVNEITQKCPYCTNGRIVKETPIPYYGYEPRDKKCEECGILYKSTTNHYHTDCDNCQGHGFIKVR